MDISSKIFVAGHNGLVGSAIVSKLESEGYINIIKRSRKELDLTEQSAVRDFFRIEKPEYIFLAAAKVGGIYANDTYPAEFIYENIMIESNIIHSAYLTKAKKLLFLGSSCIYPKLSPQPMKEEYLLSGLLEPTNEAYAIAKIAGIKLCEYYNKQYGTCFISAMPTNIYGYNDNFDLQNSHVLPALIRKVHEAKINNSDTIKVWGTGSPKREFLFADDLADACLHLMKNYSGKSFVNIGTGEDISIKDLTELVNEIIGFEGKIEYDSSMPDGTPRKLMDVTLLHSLGWKHKHDLRNGIEKLYMWFTENYK
ncbi:GDP-L-fucose synthase [soil metagenome]